MLGDLMCKFIVCGRLQDYIDVRTRLLKTGIGRQLMHEREMENKRFKTIDVSNVDIDPAPMHSAFAPTNPAGSLMLLKRLEGLID